MDAAVPPVSGAAKLSSWTKFRYGFAGLGAGTVDMPQQILLIPFYTEFFAVPPYVAGILAMVTGACEAISDPLLGILSDRTRTRIGRRRPFLLIGAVPFGLSFWMLWNPLAINPVASFLIAWLIFRLSITTVIIPLYSLGAEMSPDYDERTSIMAYLRGLVALGLLLGIVAPTLLLRMFPTARAGYSMMGLIIGIFLTLSILVTYFGTREDVRQESDSRKPETKRALTCIIRSREFWCVTTAGFLLAQCASAITSTLLVYFGLHWMKVSAADVLPATAVYLVVCLVSIPLMWAPLSRRYDKRIALSAGLCIAVVGALSLFLVPEHGMANLLVSCAIFGLGFGAVQVIPYSMMTEVVDLVAAQTGGRWEGLHYGISDFLRKLGVNLAVALSTTTLSWLGYVSEGPQPEAVVQGIRYFMIGGPALLCLAAALVILKFPISRADHAEIRRRLEEH